MRVGVVVAKMGLEAIHISKNIRTARLGFNPKAVKRQISALSGID